LTAGLPPVAGTTLRRIVAEGYSRPLPRALAGALWAQARQQIPDLDDLVASLPAQEFRTRINREAPLQVDAVATALRLFSRSWRQLRPEPEPQPSAFALSIETATQGTENDYITDDTAVFLDWDRAARSRQGWWEFRDGDRRLYVKNINVSNAENTTGADLVYVHRNPDSVVLVQYKLLESLSTHEPVFRPDRRLAKQVDRMLASGPPRITRGNKEVNARLGPDFGFVKFVLPLPSRGLVDAEPEGRYLPADAVRRMLLKPDKGPKNGKLFYVYRRRYLDGETFAKLVRDRWVGSVGNVTQTLLNVLGLAPSQERARQLTLAVETRVANKPPGRRRAPGR
jgi:hypothetical protein